jgi:hypothetical protein
MLPFASLALVAAVGCASPGQPQPPSLHLPGLAEKLTAQRIGDHIDLTWTTPSTTTDGERIKGAMTAVVCLESAPSPAGSSVAPNKRAAKTAQKRAALTPGPTPSLTPGCKEVARAPAAPGNGKLIVKLASALAVGPPALLAVRVELDNDLNRSAGTSAPVFFAGGAAPANVGTLTLSPRRDAMLVQWPPAPGGSAVMELHRNLDATPAGPLVAKVAAPAASPNPSRPFSPQSKAAAREVVLRPESSAATDPGGMLDTSVIDGNTYTYIAHRVQAVTLSGHPLELRSEPSSPASFTFHDIFPPKPPSGLVLVPGGGFGEAPSIDLSWDANLESDMLGYNVYRRHGLGEFERITAEPVPAPAFRDPHVQPGEQYTYRVTAVDQRRNESAPSATMTETLRK